MAKKTCAACDYPLEPNSTIQVKIGGQTVEVCCDDCEAQKGAPTKTVRSLGLRVPSPRPD